MIVANEITFFTSDIRLGQGNLIVAIVKSPVRDLHIFILSVARCLLKSQNIALLIVSSHLTHDEAWYWKMMAYLKPQSQQNRVSEFAMCDCVGAKHGTSMAICPVVTPRSMGTRLWLRSLTSWRITSVHWYLHGIVCFRGVKY